MKPQLIHFPQHLSHLIVYYCAIIVAGNTNKGVSIQRIPDPCRMCPVSNMCLALLAQAVHAERL